LIQGGCGQILGAGTCAEYAPSREALREDSPAKPETLYAAAKFSCGLLGRQLAEHAKVTFAWGRIFYPYGPGEDERRLVSSASLSLLRGKPFAASQGEQGRDYLHVEDVALAFCIMLEKKAEGVYNVSSGESVSVRGLLEMIGNLTGRGNLIQFGSRPGPTWDPPFILGDNQKLRALGWQPRVKLEEGLQTTLDWLRTNALR